MLNPTTVFWNQNSWLLGVWSGCSCSVVLLQQKKEDWQELVAPRLMTASPVNNISCHFGQNKLIFGNTRSVCKIGIKQEHAGNAQQSRIASVCGYHEAGRIVKPFICTPAVSGLGSGCKVHNADCSSRQQWPGTKHPFHEFKIYNCSP